MMKKLILIPLVAVSLSSCRTVMEEYGLGDPVSAVSHKEKALISARNAAIESQHADIKRGELGQAEEAYRAMPKDRDSAFRYAHLLRKVNMPEQAKMVLKPIADDPSKADEDILTEYAKTLLQLGEFKAAQNYAEQAVNKLDSAQARMVLGIAYDVQGYHWTAERHFRNALGKADPDMEKAVKNNLALCLLAQNKTAEAQVLLDSIDGGSSIEEQGIIDANQELSRKL